MTYTLWSRGRLLGESPLDFVRCLPRLRTGELHATALGMTLLARVTDTRGDALLAMRLIQRERRQADDSVPRRLDHRYDSVTADMAAADDYEEALALELRRPDGSVVPTEEIYVRDTEFMLAFAAGDADPADPLDLLDIDGEATALPDAEDDDDLRVAFDPETDVDELDDDDLFDGIDDLGLELGGWRDEPERTFPRFQLYVRVLDEADIP